MIKIVIVAHGNFAKSLVDTAELIAGKQENVYTISNEKSDSLIQLQDKIKTLLSDIIDDDGVLILTDMIGGSPSNASYKMVDIFNVEIISGVNLPMLLSAIFASKAVKNVLQLSENVFSESQKSIVNIRKYLSDKK
ncbi:MAG: PTS sugar transporter subunit IIA [Endomicrobium sp.]|jgi:PTS system mannose-specific IIA component|nr:PTS sugar transporter subunit IIA [Endomicrobium sp.]